MGIALTLSQQQKLLITPQLKQAMSILQMPALELDQYIQEQSIENPFIEWEPREWEIEKYPAKTSVVNQFDNDWWLNTELCQEISLKEVLKEQLGLMKLEEKIYRLCLTIIESLDERGYLDGSIDWIVKYRGASAYDINCALQIIQGMEPTGVGACSLQECLLLQLDHMNEQSALVRSLVEHNLGEIYKGKIRQLAAKYKVDVIEIQTAIDRISELNPKPGLEYGGRKPEFVFADIILKKSRDECEIIAEPTAIRSFSLNPSYYHLMKNTLPLESSDFLEKKWAAARWISQCIEQRSLTLRNVTNAIFQVQKSFCTLGPCSMKPLSMRQVADSLNIHESTVSRAVNDKYVLTPWGILKLKYFFSANIKQDANEPASAVHLKEKIRELIIKEDKTRPLSDQKIVEQLQAEGLDISRRTVTKYREQLNILSSVQRKRYRD